MDIVRVLVIVAADIFASFVESEINGDDFFGGSGDRAFVESGFGFGLMLCRLYTTVLFYGCQAMNSKARSASSSS